MTAGLLRDLADRLARPVGESERKRARLHLLDWLACVASARNMPAGTLARAVSGHAWEQSAYLGNPLEMDDVHRTALLHPGPVVWPAAMGVPGAALVTRLDAAVRGYEAMIAVGMALDEHHYAHWHATTTAGVFGAAAAAASLLGLSAQQTADALANAGSVSGGLWHMRHGDNATKQWHIFHALRTGRDAALHAAHGVTGPHGLLEGPQGLFAAMTRTPGALGGGADGWLIHQVSFKPFAACRHAHPAIDAALQLRAGDTLQAPFTVETYADALAFCDRPDPASEQEAKFSLQHAVAVVADGRDARPEDFTPDAIEALRELRAQVSVTEDAEFTAHYPAHFGARVNGHAVADTLGDPERPVGPQEIGGKMAMLAEWGGLDTAEADRAQALALEGDDAAALDTMLAEWLA
ncbi:MmgE/PrpD family protein [Paraurantiacibacter namhicola]|uniref:2-methylcitrate dehydratase n=1 Tax=Paraurantiacibacter namhicola TaxID=645517 RepID=A0A1C7D4I3_9SPHN|nr:MmgE/PrpD family protein [Paraurantiacibacter namhicola]ANU06367.1 2-methylcitrate dehydratase [Paraurantiacibacter namhicola]